MAAVAVVRGGGGGEAAAMSVDGAGPSKPATSGRGGGESGSNTLASYYRGKVEELELALRARTQNLRRLEAQRNELNDKGARAPLA